MPFQYDITSMPVCWLDWLVLGDGYIERIGDKAYFTKIGDSRSNKEE